MSYLEVKDLTHGFGDKMLYRSASFDLFRGEHMGVVGQNGTGKSTLVKILTGKTIPDGGSVRWQSNIKIGYLDQHAEIGRESTIASYLRTAFAPLYALEQEVLALYEKGAASCDDGLLLRAAKGQEQLEARGFYRVESEISKAAIGLGIDAYGMETPMQKLSGGQRAKVILAKLLLEQADVLLLDEPTNFLDKEHISWFADYLNAFPGAFLVVSHDCAFLERISTCICDVEFGTIKKYHGRYSDFLRQKGQQREDYIRQYHAQQREIERTEAYIRKNKAGVNSKMARGRQKQLDRVERLAPPAFTGRPVLAVKALPLAAQAALRVEGLEVGYYYPLLPKLSFTISGGQKVVVTGFNGIGKSTLLKTLTGLIPKLSGSYRFAESVRFGYYEQELRWEREESTPIQILAQAYPDLKEKQIRKELAAFGVKADCVMQPIRSLSGGEQSKVKLCRLLLTPFNFLILDEPTNHLDADTKEALRDALVSFSGSVLLVSHEERFYRDWADRILSIEDYLK